MAKKISESLWIAWNKCYINLNRLHQKWISIDTMPGNLQPAIASNIHADKNPWLKERKNVIVAKQHSL